MDLPYKHKKKANYFFICTKITALFWGGYFWVDDGARTHDTRNHNPMLYQLNYIHHVWDCKGTKKIVPCKGAGEKNQSAAGGVYVPWRS